MEAIVTLSQIYPVFFYSLVFLVSLIIGSFLNVVIYRLPIMLERSWRQEYENYFNSQQSHQTEQDIVESTTHFNLILPNSTCPSCNHRIRPWENIPVISYLMLKGKCSHCKTTISLRYPLVELLTAAVGTYTALQLGATTQALWAIVFAFACITMMFIDIDKMLLPDQITLPLIWLGLLLSTQNVFVGTTDAIIGAVAGYMSLWSVYWLFKLTTGRDGLGYGDFKMLAAIGAFVGWQGLPVVILVSSFVGIIAGVVIMIVKHNGKSMVIPFAPYLAVAGWLTLLFKDAIITAYLNMVL